MVSILTGNKFDPNTDIPDLDGKHNAAKIFLLSQKEEHADEAMEELKKYGDTSRVQWIHCDLKDLKQTDSAAKQLQSEKQIDA
ncbi:MAG: hypothetical protein Q9180_007025, partial [Flavoplaca navasiana]